MADGAIIFSGTDPSHYEAFISAIHKAGRDAGKFGDDEWMAGEAASRLRGEALKWYFGLEPAVQKSWRAISVAMMEKWSSEEWVRNYPFVASAEKSAPALGPPTPAAAATSEQGPSASVLPAMHHKGAELAYRIKLLHVTASGQRQLRGYLAKELTGESDQYPGAFVVTQDRAQAVKVTTESTPTAGIRVRIQFLKMRNPPEWMSKDPPCLVARTYYRSPVWCGVLVAGRQVESAYGGKYNTTYHPSPLVDWPNAIWNFSEEGVLSFLNAKDTPSLKIVLGKTSNGADIPCLWSHRVREEFDRDSVQMELERWD